ncbi:MAG: hypothetical protein N3A54_06315 [Patescibacteria group bacterium]|nr:hypothetical protein [Patescibacteria group bacterium]
MKRSIESIHKEIYQLPSTDTPDSQEIFEEVNTAYREYDEQERQEKMHLRRLRVLFRYRGPKRHESRPHHLPGSPVKAEAILTGTKGVPWRRP